MLIRRTAIIVMMLLLAIGLVELTRPLREGLSLTVVEGSDHSYAGKYAGHAAYQELLEESVHLRAQALSNVERRVGLQPTRMDTIVVRFVDGLQPDQPVATRRTRYVNGRKCQLLTMFLEPILLGTVEVERSLTHLGGLAGKARVRRGPPCRDPQFGTVRYVTGGDA